MVFTVGEEVNQPDQGSVLKGKQRRHVSASRKSKGALSTLAPSKAKDSSPHRAGAKNNHSKPVDNEMGNASLQDTENGPQNTATVQQKAIVSSSTDLTEQHEEITGTEQSKSNGGEQISTSISTESIPMDSQDLGASSVLGNDDKSEVAKLKQLLMLQVSLISRQQDLLRLRDREIMQLKASNTNYKCQLGRVRRRMSKRKSDADESPKLTKRKISESQLDAGNQDLDGASNVASTPLPDTTVTPQQTDGQKSKKRRLEYLEGNTEESYDVANDSASRNTEVLKEDYEAPGTSGVLSTPQSAKVPVPVEFIAQKQAELMHAMMISPPDKAVKTFCDITKSSSPPLDEFPFKICDRCPHCVAIAQEIIRLFKTAESIKKSPKKIDKEVFNIAGVLFSSDLEEAEIRIEGKKFPIMRTSYSYYRIPPSFDQSHWWWDLKCGDIKSDSSLKIPTWKEHILAPLPVDSSADIVEAVDDQTFTKRHSKLEYDEKRRKRWDIQRIREYRYNEKLRQKIHKQGAVYDSPIIESFSGHLHDAMSVEVNDSLPVNVFGYPAPQMEPEEFSLTPMRESVKSVTQTVGPRKRGRRA